MHGYRVKQREKEILSYRGSEIRISSLQRLLGLADEMSYHTFRRHVRRIWAEGPSEGAQRELIAPLLPPPPDQVSAVEDSPPHPLQALRPDSRESLSKAPSPEAPAPQSPRRKRGFVSARVGRDPVDLDPHSWRKQLSSEAADDEDKKDRK